MSDALRRRASSHGMLQSMATLYNMLRDQKFDMYQKNPRMLPRRFTPAQLNVDCTPDPEEAEPQPPLPPAAGAKSK